MGRNTKEEYIRHRCGLTRGSATHQQGFSDGPMQGLARHYVHLPLHSSGREHQGRGRCSPSQIHGERAQESIPHTNDVVSVPDLPSRSFLWTGEHGGYGQVNELAPRERFELPREQAHAISSRAHYQAMRSRL